MKDVTLLILAAGMGSRYGGLKQIDPVGPNNEIIIDYSIYDAIIAGFTKVVVIIKPENLEDFKECIGKYFENKIKVEYVFQDLEEAKRKYNLPENRVKPLGTTHAVLCAKDAIKDPFVIINADDFYGRNAYIDAINFLKDNDYNANGAILYKVENTLSEHGAVKRGVCNIESDILTKAIESSIEKKENKIIASPLSGQEPFEIDSNQPVSMSMFVLLPSIFPLLEEEFNKFLENSTNLEKDEALLIDALENLIATEQIKIKTRITDSKWIGMTYKEDKQLVADSINKLIEDRVYPNSLRDL